MYSLRPVAISGANGSRSTMFTSGVNDFFRTASARSPFLGQTTDQEWYNEAKREVAKFDAFVMRLRKVANKAVRDDLAGRYIGNPEDTESGAYGRNSVAQDIGEAESYKPVNYLIFSVSRRRNRVERLDDINNSFESDLVSAEQNWGILPEPQVIERIVQVPGAAASPLVPILVVGGLAVAGLALFGVL
jgi:hypothetical protein